MARSKGLAAVCVLLGLWVSGRNVLAQDTTAAAADPQFVAAVKAYMELRGRAVAKLPPASDKMPPAVVLQRRAQLQEEIRSSRKQAVAGELLSPALVQALRSTLQGDTFVLTGREATAMARETSNPPDNVSVPRVNSEYPNNLGLVSPPATALVRLPELPPELEYRLIGPHLILRDIDANLIVDVAPNVLRAR